MTRAEGGSHSSARRSSIVCGTVGHLRATPRRHTFSYPMVTLQLDVDELGALAVAPKLFAHNRYAVCSVWDSDYLFGLDGEKWGAPPAMEASPPAPSSNGSEPRRDDGSPQALTGPRSPSGQSHGGVREKTERILRQQGVTTVPARMTLVTMPRLFGYVFNPVSFVICFDRDNKVSACITQVNNTFGETHLYPLVCEPSEMPVTWRFPKKFFVSPFFDTEGEYTVIVGSEGARLSLQVDLYKQGQQVFSALLEGAAKPLTRLNLVVTLITFPLTQLLTMPRIHLQALFLFFKAKATPWTKPQPSDPYTIRSRQNIIHRARLWLLSVLRASRGA